MNGFKYLLVVFVCAVSFFIQAEECVYNEEKKTRVFFGNGMFTEPSEARRNARIIEEMLVEMARDPRYSPSVDDLGNISDDTGEIEVALSLNYPEYDPRFAITEVGVQRIAADESLFREFYQYYATTIDKDLEDHVTAYTDSLKAGHRLMVIAHSQGNFYANNAYDIIKAKEPDLVSSMKIIGLATPDSKIRNGKYITLHSDYVIEAVNLLFDSTLDPHTTNTDKKGHAFKSYLNGDESRRELKGIFSEFYENTLYPTAKTKAGTFTVSMDWNTNSDMDLHIYEPTGSHVFFANKLGLSGELDEDHSSGEGTEHYTVSCDSLEDGVYEVYGSMFNGEPTETAVSIKAGTEYRTFNTFFTEEEGAFGGVDPSTHIARILSNKRNDGRFEFRIVSP